MDGWERGMDGWIGALDTERERKAGGLNAMKMYS